MKKTERKSVIHDKARENYGNEKIVHRVSRKTIFPLIKKSFKIKCSGLENIPVGESCVFAMNHQSALDLFIASAILVPHTNRNLSIFLHKLYYDFPFLGILFRRWQAIRVDRSSDEAKKSSLLEGVQKLRSGNNVLIFPEGDILGAPLNKLGRAYTGVVQLAILSRKKIIPVGIKGTYHAWRLPHGFPQNPFSLVQFNFLHLIEINFGKQIDLRKYWGIRLEEKTELKKRLLRKLTTKLMVKIGKLAGQQYGHDLELLKHPLR